MSRSAAPLLLGLGVGGAVLGFLAFSASAPAGQKAGKMIGDWIGTLLRKTSAHEGTYHSVQRNLDGQGVSYGILQWTQRGGGLSTVLHAMRAAAPAEFDRVFGGSAAAARMLTAVAAKSLGPVDGANLWDEPWLGRFQAAGQLEVFQRAQRDVASSGDHMRGAIEIARLLGIQTERAMTLYYNRTVHQGSAGALGPAKRLLESYASGQVVRPQSDRQVLAQYAWLCAAKFRRNTKPESEHLNATIRWVQLKPGSLEYDLELRPDGSVALTRLPQKGATWHGVTGQWDLWDLIIKRTADILNDPDLRDQPVELDKAMV